MNRFFLTLLALMTGFVAQVAPAQAAVREGTEIGSVQAVAGAVRLARQVAVRAAQVSVAHESGLTNAVPLPRFDVASPSVRIGIDRARQ
jgi:hypothetical protein